MVLNDWMNQNNLALNVFGGKLTNCENYDSKPEFSGNPLVFFQDI